MTNVAKENAKAHVPFPWDNVMAFGFSVLKLSSDEFWAMTPREIAHAMRAYAPARGLSITREDFLGLMQQFPDEKEKQ